MAKAATKAVIGEMSAGPDDLLDVRGNWEMVYVEDSLAGVLGDDL